MLVICWDYDGTLVSSEKMYKNMFLNLISKNKNILSTMPNDAYFKEFAGSHPYTFFYRLKNDHFLNENFILSSNEINIMVRQYLTKYDDLILNDNIIFILETLSKCKNILMAIVTSTLKEDFKLKYSKKSTLLLKKYFNIQNNIYICSEVGNKKLKPDSNGYVFAYYDLVKKYNLNKKKTCFAMVEDSVSGCKSAFETKRILNYSSQFQIIGFCPQEKYTKKNDLKAIGANEVFYDSTKLLSYLYNIASSPFCEEK